MRLTVLAVWVICFSAYIGFVFETKDIEKGDWQFYILVLGCQGLGVALELWANILQIIKGYKMSKALGRYEEWVSSLPIRKVRVFLGVYSSVCSIGSAQFWTSFARYSCLWFPFWLSSLKKEPAPKPGFSSTSTLSAMSPSSWSISRDSPPTLRKWSSRLYSWKTQGRAKGVESRLNWPHRARQKVSTTD